MTRTAALSSISVFVLALAAGVASAQEAAPTTEEEVVVTGSRIARRDYQSASPISTINVEAMTQSGTINVETALNQLPQFVQGQNQSAIGAVAGGGRATLNLRGLGETRNLVLLDGRRLPLASAFGVVDVNIIPTSIIEGVETITGGASAVYGSDAMSGVVNFKTRRSFDGLQLDARVGDSFDGGAQTSEFSLLGGASSDDDRAHAIVSIGYADRDVLWGYDRPEFFSQGVLSSFIGTGTFVPAANNLPQQSVVNSVFAGYGVAAGAVPNTRSLGFNDDGTLFSQIGALNYKGPTTFFFSTLGGTVRQPVTMQEYLVQPMERRHVFAKFDYDVNDAVELYGQALHTRSRVTGQVGWSPTLFVVPTIPVTNPFIPAALRTILASRPTPGADFTLNERFMGFEDRKFHSDVNVEQYVLGVRGSLPIEGWSYDIYTSHDTMDLEETQDKALLLTRMRNLLYAADGGRSICAGGFNPFGLTNETSVSAACRNYVETETHDVTRTEQNIFEANVTGALFELPAGAVEVSLTGTYRENSFSFDPDNARESSDIIGTQFTTPASGSVAVTEGALEVLVPLLRDAPLAESLELNLGYRVSDYDTSGSFDTYRAELTWEPVESLLIRGGYERAIRAPNIGELFSTELAQQVQFGSPPGGGDPCDTRSTARTGASAAQVRALCIATGVPASVVDTYQYTTVAVGSVASGSTTLTPEEADTKTFGFVWRPEDLGPWLSGFSFSVDYYDIEIANLISQVPGGTTINKCYNLDGSNPTFSATNRYCALIARSATTGDINLVGVPYLNLGGLHTDGIDIQADWDIDLHDVGISPGALKVNLVVNLLNSYEVQILPDDPVRDFVGTIDGAQAQTTPPSGLPLPDYKIFGNFSYTVGPAEIGVRWRHLPEMDDATSVTRPASPAAGVPAYDIFDLQLGWTFDETFSLRGGVTNIADEDPPVVGGTLGQTQPGTYDIVGRSYYLALSKRF